MNINTLFLRKVSVFQLHPMKVSGTVKCMRCLILSAIPNYVKGLSFFMQKSNLIYLAQFIISDVGY